MIAKRSLDIICSALGLIVLSPVILIIAILIYWKMGSPIFFRQDRPGLNGKSFKMTKFRTMEVEQKATKGELTDDRRLTPLGNSLRELSLDELPELWDILTGKMSLVGPRPLLEEYLPRYSDEQARRHELRPGLTGWAQVNGRNAISWQEKFELDVWYVDNRSFFLDLKILWLTIMKVLKRDGISAEGEATMPPFEGNDK